MYRFNLLTILAAIALWSLPVQAQQQRLSCPDREELLNHLSANYEEAPVAMGLTINGDLLEVVVAKTGSWSIIVTRPSGISCALAAGMNWESSERFQINDPDAQRRYM